jgi:murein L,D-transpeptidase YcbB/YkuD
MTRHHFAAAALVVAVVAGCRDDTPERVSGAIRGSVTSKQTPEYASRARWKLIGRIYHDHGYGPLWTDGKQPLDRARDLVATICSSEREGLHPGEYDLAGLRQHLKAIRSDKKLEPEEIAALDLRLTALFLDYGADLLAGRLDPTAADSGWFIRSRRSSMDSTLHAAALAPGLGAMLAALQPKLREYRELVRALAQYRGIQSRGGWHRIPSGHSLRRGATGPAVAALRARLSATGDFRGATTTEAVYDRGLAQAVARFQERHGIEPDGKVSAATLVALNVPVDVRVRQMELNLERYRRLPNEFGPRYVMVNIPEYELRAFDGGRQVMQQRVIVGGEYENATPVFADSMTQIVFNPKWHVPRRVLVDELLPRIQENIYFLAEHGYEVVDTSGDSLVTDFAAIDWEDVDSADPGFQLRRKPGPGNPLGRVKFLFPNQFSVYLHDTPSRELFDSRKRTLSHGCVRVEKPVELAAYALAGQRAWDEEKIQTVMAAADSAQKIDSVAADSLVKERGVTLERPVPVYLVYLTAFAREGVVHFREDPYDRDAPAMRRLSRAKPLDAAICPELEELL